MLVFAPSNATAPNLLTFRIREQLKPEYDGEFKYLTASDSNSDKHVC